MTIKYKTQSFLQSIGRVAAIKKSNGKRGRISNIDDGPRVRVKLTDDAEGDERVAIGKAAE
jgi:hypothetical protein